MSRRSETHFLESLSKKLMNVSSFRDAVNRNAWFHDALKDEAFVREMMQFAEIGNGIYSAKDIEIWRSIFSKIVLLPDGVIHTRIEMDIFDMLNRMIGKYASFMKFRFYDNDKYIDYAVSAQNQSEIKHNHEVPGKTWLWVIRYGNRTAVADYDYQNQAQFNFNNAAIAFNLTGYFEVTEFESFVRSSGLMVRAEANQALGIEGTGYERWIAVDSLDDVKKLAPVILYCYRMRLADFGKILSDAAAGL